MSANEIKTTICGEPTCWVEVMVERRYCGGHGGETRAKKERSLERQAQATVKRDVKRIEREIEYEVEDSPVPRSFHARDRRDVLGFMKRKQR